MEKEREENVWSREIYLWWSRRKMKKKFGEGNHIFSEEKKNGERKGGKCLEKENIF